jgi:hypothetical protein
VHHQGALGGQCAGPSPVDRRNGGLKRSVATEDYGIPLGITCAGGQYDDAFGHTQAFAANEINGTWHGAIEVPGTVVLNQGGAAGIVVLSRPSAGHCSAGGDYVNRSENAETFVVNES